MSRFSTTLDVSKELKGFEDNSGDEVEEEIESSNSEHDKKPKKGRNYAAEFETYDREDDSEENLDNEMDELDSDINGKSEAKTVSEDQPEKVIVKSYNVKKKQKAEFVDVDEVAEPKEKDDDEEDDDENDDGSDEEDRGAPRKVNGGKNNGNNGAPDGKTSWLWTAILIILIIGAGAAGYMLFKNARQHAAETNLSGFPEQIAKDNEILDQNFSMSLVGELDTASEVEPAAGENETAEVLPAANESLVEPIVDENISAEPAVIVEPAAPANESNESNSSALKDVLIQGLS